MEELLKGNFKVKNALRPEKETETSSATRIKEELRKRALASLGGSMVYVERNRLNWDGDV